MSNCSLSWPRKVREREREREKWTLVEYNFGSNTSICAMQHHNNKSFYLPQIAKSCRMGSYISLKLVRLSINKNVGISNLGRWQVMEDSSWKNSVTFFKLRHCLFKDTVFLPGFWDTVPLNILSIGLQYLLWLSKKGSYEKSMKSGDEKLVSCLFG